MTAMKRITFTAGIEIPAGEYDGDPESWIQFALDYGGKHQDFGAYHDSDVAVVVEDWEEAE